MIFLQLFNGGYYVNNLFFILTEVEDNGTGVGKTLRKIIPFLIPHLIRNP